MMSYMNWMRFKRVENFRKMGCAGGVHPQHTPFFGLPSTEMKRAHMNPISRRDFLKLGGLSLLGLAMAPFQQVPSLALNQQGRVIYEHITAYKQPSFSGDVVRQHWADSVFPILEVTVGDEEPAHNMVWYRIGNDEYVHSGGVQPVKTILNQPNWEIAEGGQLAEVSVPYTDAYWEIDIHHEVAYRFYYETTHWVVGLVYGRDGTPLYHILDDKWDLIYYVPARHLRLIPASEVSTLSPDVPAEEKLIEVDTANQVVIAYEYGRPVFITKAATGAEFSNGEFYTPFGRFYTNHKMPSRHMSAGNLAYNGFDLPGIPWVSYITERGVAFHGTYWHNDFGLPRSHGCINLTSQASKWIYRWTLPAVPADQRRIYEEVGTAVDVV